MFEVISEENLSSITRLLFAHGNPLMPNIVLNKGKVNNSRALVK